MNCTTESKNCQKREMRRWKAKITRKPSPVSKRHWTSFLEPKEDWEAYLWLVGSIGDAHFMMGNYGKSLEFSANATISERQTILSSCCALARTIWKWRMKPMQLNFFSAPICSKGKKIFKEDWKYFQWLSGHVNLKQKIITKLYGTHEKVNNRQNQATGRQRSKPEREFTERGSLCHYIRYGLVP